MVLCDGSEAKPKTGPSSSQTPSKPKLPFSHSQVFPPFSFSSLFSPFILKKKKIYSSSCFYCRVLSFYLNSWANSKSSFHKHFRYIAQVPYNLLLSFLFSPAVFFSRQPNIAVSFMLSEMEVSDSGDVKGSTPHQTLLGSCCQRVWQRF